MKRAIVLVISMIAAMVSNAQLSPVRWSFKAGNISGNKYEVHLTASIQTGWHVYSQIQPNDAIAMPTLIKFSSNPLLTLTGKVKEIGQMEKNSVKALGITQNQYKDKVDFVQELTLKGKVRTSISGDITFQVCTDELCLPPKTIPFTIALQ